jgi:hypothetical protein
MWPGTMAVLAAGLALAVLSGCSSAQIDAIPTAVGGLPEGAPPRPAVAPEYPAVHDMPPSRGTALLDAEQQEKLEADLIAARNRLPNQQKGRAGARKGAQEQAGQDRAKGKPKKDGQPKSAGQS